MSAIPSESSAREILGVGGEASFNEIKKAHKVLVRLFHPDRASQDVESQRKAHEAMSRINGAWEVIENRQSAGLLGQVDFTSEKPFDSATWNLVTRRPNEKECGLCGSTPAQWLILHGVVSYALAIGWPKYNGPLCKSCALALVRHIVAETMTRGWWGIGVFFTPILLIHLTIQIIRIHNMPEPTFRDYRVITPHEMPIRAQKSPLKQLLPVSASTVAFIVIVFLIHHAFNPTEQLFGDQSPLTTQTSLSPPPVQTECWTARDSTGGVAIVDCSDPAAVSQTLAKVKVQSDCPIGTTEVVAADSAGYLTCLGLKP